MYRLSRIVIKISIVIAVILSQNSIFVNLFRRILHLRKKGRTGRKKIAKTLQKLL